MSNIARTRGERVGSLNHVLTHPAVPRLALRERCARMASRDKENGMLRQALFQRSYTRQARVARSHVLDRRRPLLARPRILPAWLRRLHEAR